MTKTPDGELAARAKRLSERMAGKGIDLALVMQNVDRYYLSGTVQEGVLLLPGQGEPVLFVRKTLERAARESALRRVVPFKRLEDVRNFVLEERLPAGTIGMELDVVPARFYLAVASLFPGSRIVDVGMELRSLRSVKSEWEISLLREAGRRLDRVFARIRGEIRPGLTEHDVFRRMSGFLLEEGSSTFTRIRGFNMEGMPPYVLSGPSAARASVMDSPSGGGDGVSLAFPFGSGLKTIGVGEPIVVDTALTFEGYVSDCTRVFSVGPVGEEFKRAHAVSDECHGLFVETAREGAFIPDLYRMIAAHAASRGLAGAFMGGVKFIGHGVGLELDELPLIAEGFEETLKEGMVVAFEPKFVFPGGAVGYENTYLIENGRPVSFHLTETAIQSV